MATNQPQQQQDLTQHQIEHNKKLVKKRQAEKAAMSKAKSKQGLEDMRSHIREMLQPENRDNPVAIGGRNEYLEMDAAYKSLANNADIDEATIYPSDADWVSRTAELTAAITDFSDILDKPQKNQGDEGDEANTAVKVIKSLSKLEVQLLAGKILTATCDAHCGRFNVPSWRGPNLKSTRKDKYESFDERFEAVCSGLRQSKAIVKSIMDAEFPFAIRFATAPKHELKSKMDNKILNDTRATNTQALKKRAREIDDDGDKEDSGVQKVTKRPRAKASSSGAPPLRPRLPRPDPSQLPNVGVTPTTAASPTPHNLGLPDNDQFLSYGHASDGFAGQMRANLNTPVFGSVQFGGSVSAADNGLGSSGIQYGRTPSLSPGGSAASQPPRYPAGATRAEGWTNPRREEFSLFDPNDASQWQGPMVDVPDDNSLFSSEDFNYGGNQDA